ncbi:MAG: tyrosine-type recombinase/integrase [Alphaproteobacteria bacterium]
MPLNNTQVNSSKPKDKPYKMADGGGMYLEIMPNGSKYWRMKYRWLGKEKRLALGIYPTIGLAQARERREEAKKLLANQIDPSEHKKAVKKTALIEAENTFKAVALEWFEVQKDRWSKSYGDKILRRLEMHAFPYIGNRPISQITPPELLDCLRKVEKSGALDMAGRAKQVCGQVFRYGIQTGKCERDPSNDLRGALKTAKTENFRTIDIKDLPGFLDALERNEARLFERTRRAIWLSLYTFCRPGEIRQAKWADIDMERGIWTIPSSMMKARRDHIVPLSKQSIAVLKAQYEETGHINSDYVFPSQIHPRKPMSDGTVNRAIERLGYGETMVAHGVRALARTTIRERLGYDSEIIEKQLAHKTKNPLGESYDRTQFLDQRIHMMQDWTDYLDDMANKGRVIQGHFRKRDAS